MRSRAIRRAASTSCAARRWDCSNSRARRAPVGRARNRSRHRGAGDRQSAAAAAACEGFLALRHHALRARSLGDRCVRRIGERRAGDAARHRSHHGRRRAEAGGPRPYRQDAGDLAARLSPACASRGRKLAHHSRLEDPWHAARADAHAAQRDARGGSRRHSVAACDGRDASRRRARVGILDHGRARAVPAPPAAALGRPSPPHGAAHRRPARCADALGTARGHGRTRERLSPQRRWSRGASAPARQRARARVHRGARDQLHRTAQRHGPARLSRARRSQAPRLDRAGCARAGHRDRRLRGSRLAPATRRRGSSRSAR